MDELRGWSNLPRALRVSFVAGAVAAVMRYGMTMYERDGNHLHGTIAVLRVVETGIGFGWVLMMLVGTLQTARRLAGATTGFQLATASAIGGLVMYFVYALLGAVFVLRRESFESFESMYLIANYVGCAIALLGVVGWSMASRNPGLGVAAGVVVLALYESHHLFSWFGVESHQHLQNLLLLALGLAEPVVYALLASVSASRNQVIAPPRSPTEGFHQLASGMWTGVVAIVMLGFVLLATSRTNSEHAIEIGIMFVTALGLVGTMLFGVGATQACREPESAPAGWFVTVAAILMFSACGLAFSVLLTLFEMYIDHNGYSSIASDDWMVSTLVMLASGGLGAAAALAGGAAYARARGEITAASRLRTSLIAFCVLMASASVVLWSARDTSAETGALMRVGIAGMAAIAAAIIGAQGFSTAAKLFGTTPTIPTATLHRS